MTELVDTPPVSRILERSLLRALVTPLVVLHLQVTVVLAVADGSGAAWGLVGLHLAAVAYGVRMLVDRGAIGVLVAASYAGAALDYTITDASDGVATLATSWLVNITAAAAAFLLPPRPAVLVPVGAGAGLTTLLIVHHPDWPSNFQTGVVVTGVAITVVCRLAIRYLRDFSARADAETLAAQEGRRAALVALTTGREAAEAARTLHDTAINTLGAIANGGRGVHDVELVRARCAGDTEVIRVLAEGEAGALVRRSLDRIVATSELPVRRTGWSDDRLAASLEASGDHVVGALLGAVHESLLNAAKHSGADEVELDVTGDAHGVTVVIRDRGIGFDRGGVTTGHGLAESVQARCADAGVHVLIGSRRGAGTTVTLRVRTDEAITDEPGEFAAGVEATSRRTAWLWPSGVAVVGAAIELVNRPGVLSWTWAALAIVVGCTGLAWLTGRRGAIPVAVQAVLVAATPAAFVASFAGVDFGRHDVELWQTLPATGPVVLLLHLTPTRRPLGLAVGALVLGAAVTAGVMAADGDPDAGLVPVGAVSALAVVVALLVFRQVTTRIGARATVEHRRVEEARLEVAALEAATAARARWRAAGLQTSGALLDGIATGWLDPTDPAVRDACAAEERHLRQLLLLSPEIVHLGYWLVRASSDARERGVRLTVRTGDLDAPDEAAAAWIGTALVGAVAATAPGDALTIGVFRGSDHGLVTIVGAAGEVPEVQASPDPRWTVDRHVQAGQTLIEIRWPRRPEAVDG